MSEDYYSILEISKNAEPTEIKKSYRKLAIKWHPDKNSGDPAAEAKFKKISEAYDVLSDNTKKSQYDAMGHDAYTRQGSGGSSGGFHSNPFDVFNSFFGGGGGGTGPGPFSDFFGGRNNQQQRKTTGSNLQLNIKVNLTDVIFGKEATIKYKREEKCNQCRGTGAAPHAKVETCGTCRGSGMVYRQMGVMQIQQHCPSCDGTGKHITAPCHTCSGSGIEQTSSSVKIKIPKGASSGVKLRVSSGGNSDKVGNYGDLYIILIVDEHELYERSGDDLIMKQSLEFYEIIMGCTKKIKTPHGTINLQIPRCSKNESILKIKEHGVPSMVNGHIGDFYVVLNAKFPETLTNEQCSILELYKKTK